MNTATMKETSPRNFPAMLEQYKGELHRALPTHLKAERFARIALTAFRQNPKLGQCDPRSVFAAVIQASQLGLEPNTLGRSYLIPYERKQLIDGQWKKITECQFVPGWKGLVDLVNRAGNATVWTGAVFEGDEFNYALGDRPFILHKPGDEFDVNRLMYVYAVGRVKGSEWPVIEVWSMNRVRIHLARYNKVGTKHYAHENMEMYARKVVLLQVLKYMPASPEMNAAIALNDAAEIGSQGLTIEHAVNNDYVPPPVVDEETGEIQEEPHQEPIEGPAPVYPMFTAEAFNAKKDGWKKLIDENKKTPAALIAMIESKGVLLSEEQKFEIDSWHSLRGEQ
jgi:recombination protein RecT